MASDRALDGQLYRRLLTLENLQFASIDANPDALSALVKGLSEAQVITKRGISQGSLTRRTLALARSIASAGRSLANHLLGVERINADVEAKRQTEMIAAMDRLSLEDSECTPTGDTSICTGVPSKKPTVNTKKANKRPLHSSSNASKTGNVLHPSNLNSSPTSASDECFPPKPSHVSQSYKWLLANLHNPYPPIAIKRKIASEAGVPVKSVEDWFTHTRRRIGWTSIVKRFFRGCRAEAVDCAMSVLAGEPVKQPILSDPLEALLAMRTSALSLFENPSEVSEIAKKIEATVKNHLPNAVVDEEVTLHQRSDVYADAKGHSDANGHSTEDIGGDATHISSGMSRVGCTSKKRCRDSNDDSGSHQKVTQLTRPSKRLRSLVSSCSPNTESCASILSPSPADTFSSASSSPEHLPTSYPTSSAVLSLPVLPPCSPQMSRKRRNSDTVDDAYPVAKRLRKLAPRVQNQTSTCLDGKLARGTASDFDLSPSGSATASTSDVTDASLLIQNCDIAPKDNSFDLHNLNTGETSSSAPHECLDTMSHPFGLLGDYDVFPALPDFTLQASDIQPPSTESFSSSSELFLSNAQLGEADSYFSPNSSLAFDDSQSLSSLELDFPPDLQLDTLASDSAAICDPPYDAMSPSDIFQELLRIDREVKIERSGNFEEEQKEHA